MQVTLTFINRWWDKHFYTKYDRPAEPSDDELLRVSVERQRFLSDMFGTGALEEALVPGGSLVNTIMKWCVDFIPFLLGAPMKCIGAGFWQAIALS